MLRYRFPQGLTMRGEGPKRTTRQDPLGAEAGRQAGSGI